MSLWRFLPNKVGFVFLFSFSFGGSLDEVMDGEEVGKCPSCSLIIHVVYSIDDENEDQN